MKRILTGILSLLLLLCAGFACACNNSSFVNPTLIDGGNVISQGGFVLETDNYLYFINGESESTENNSFGTPVKGSLMAVTKSSIISGSPVSEIIVPKLFVAQDLNSGLFINNNYVYYGSPSTDKNSSGAIANNEMTFFRTKLDGTDTEKYLTINALSYEYRFASYNNDVYIIYYNENDKKIISYNTTSKEEIEVASFADKTKGRYESLGTYKFFNLSTSVVVAYVSNVYTEDYIENKAELANYSRAKANYNYVYLYRAGDTKISGNEFYGEKLLNGSEDDLTFDLTYSFNDVLLYTEKTPYSDAINKSINLLDTTEINELNKNISLISDEALIKSLNEIYVSDSEDKNIVKISLIGSDVVRENICKSEKVSHIIDVYDGNLYYFNSENVLSRIAVSNADANIVKVSSDTCDVTWYKPQIITFNEKSYIFYIDNSEAGSKYVYCTDLNSEVKEKDESDDKKSYYLDSECFIGKMLEKDYANKTNAAIGKIENVLNYTLNEDGTINVESYNFAKECFDELKATYPDSVKYVTDEKTDKYEKVEKAIKIANLYLKLKTFTSENKEQFSEAYSNAKAYRAELLNISEDMYKSVRDLLKEEIKYYYQQAEKVFDPTVS